MNWKKARLGDLCTVFTDGDWIESKDQSESGIRLIQTGNIGSASFKDRGEKARFVSESTFARLRCTEVRPGDCLVSRLPDPVGRSCLIPETGERMITAVDCSILRFDQARILPKFFVYYSQSAEYAAEIDKRVTGTTRSRISRSNLGNVIIPLPPLADQLRIVSILDEAFDGLAAVESATRRIMKNVDELLSNLRQEIILKPSDGWTEFPLKEVCKVDWGNTDLTKSSYVSGGQFLAVSAAGCDGRIGHREHDAFVPVLSAIGARCGRMFLPTEPFTAIKNTITLTPKVDIVSGQYLFQLLSSIDLPQRGAGQPFISKGDIQQFRVTLPPLMDQANIVEAIEQGAQAGNELLDNLRRRLALFAELKQSLLVRAFSGKLSGKSAAANDNDFATPEQAANILAFMHWRHERANRSRFFGHVMAQKSLDLVERVGGVELGRLPYKDAAGPNDKPHMAGAEVWARKNKFFEFAERPGGGYDFKKLANYGAMLSAAKTALKPIEAELDRVANILVGKDKIQAEIFATVLAAWNNLIIDGKDATEAAILREARDDWHPDKIDLPIAKFQDAIREIRSLVLVPDGTAKAVRHRQAALF